ncbi:MAG: transposase [Planctomycetes bacterium]|nr:transposase [Planctomycetota bacterium]
MSRKPRPIRIQQQLAFARRGGRRPGAGRKPKGERPGVSHKTREALAARFPVHVTVRLERGLPGLRDKQTYRALKEAFAAGSDRFGFRLVQYSVQTNHLHMICEGRDKSALARGMQGLMIRLARALNRLWGRCGRVFADRYHGRILRTPREVRSALCYVLNNARRHAARLGRALLDPFSTGFWFDGWKETGGRLPQGVAGREEDPPLARARSWLLAVGWRRRGLLGMREVPAAGLL